MASKVSEPSCGKETKFLWRDFLIKLNCTFVIILKAKNPTGNTHFLHITHNELGTFFLLFFFPPTSIMQRAGRCVAKNAHARNRTPLYFCKMV